MQKKIYLFTDRDASQAQVGGKGFSLMRMTGQGFPVPPGQVLGVHFFDEWLEQLRADEALRLHAADSEDVLKSKTAALQEAAGKLSFSEAQRGELDRALASLQFKDNQLFSVRSSSPEEDMEGGVFRGDV